MPQLRTTAHNIPTRRRTLSMVLHSNSLNECKANKTTSEQALRKFSAQRPETQSECEAMKELPVEDGQEDSVEEVDAGTPDENSANYPEILVTSRDLSTFESSVRDHPEALSMASVLTSSVTRWVNTSHSVDKRRNTLWLAWASWHNVIHLYHVIEERRNARELTKVAKRLMEKAPKQRRPPDIIKLLKFHSAAMAQVQDYAQFKTFGGNLSKKQLQAFYKHARLKMLPKNTPIFLQGTPGNHYFILLKGSVKIFQASDKRQREIVTTLGPYVMKSPPSSIPDGFLGRPSASFTVPPGSPGVGFGGIQMMSGPNFSQSASASEDLELIYVDQAHYKSHLYASHLSSYALTSRSSSLRSMPAFSHLTNAQVHHLAADFTDNMYTGRGLITHPSDPFNRLIVIASGSVTLSCISEDPLHPTRLLTVDCVTLTRGCVIGDVELSTSSPKYKYLCSASSAVVKTYELPLQTFKRHVWDNSHAGAAREGMNRGARGKAEFHRKRVGEEVTRYLNLMKEMSKRRTKIAPGRGDVVDVINRVKDAWEREYKDYLASIGEPMRVKPCRDYFTGNRMDLVRDVQSASGVRAVERGGIRVVKKKGRVPEGVRDFQAPPYVPSESRGSSRGGVRSRMRGRDGLFTR